VRRGSADFTAGTLHSPGTIVGQHGYCARLDCALDIVAPVLRHALQRREQEARLHLAAVSRDAGDLDGGSARNELVEFHGVVASDTRRLAASALEAVSTGRTSSSGAARAITFPAIEAAV
jgi:hypothetical protein